MSEQKSFEAEIGGRTLKISTGLFAGQADGACTVQYGDTVILATAVMGDEPRDGIDYFPLMVDYEEKLYAAGKIKGSRFIKREGRPTDEAILAGRVIDRSIRPFFNQAIRRDVQVVLTVLCVDQENDPDILSLVAAATAVSLSPIPWDGPVAGIRVGRINGEWVLNPSYEAREKSDLDLIVSANNDKVVMLEAGAKEVAEDVMIEAIQFGHKHVRKIISLINEVVAAVGQPKVDLVGEAAVDETEQAAKATVEKKVTAWLADRLPQLLESNNFKADRQKLETELDEALKADNEVSKDNRAYGLTLIDAVVDEAIRQRIINDGKRVDGRGLDDLRPISAMVGLLPRTHGSGLFNRGETQALSIVTLGSPGDEQLLDGMEATEKKRYMHHYNFPPFSVGEARPLRGPGRREIGHGALAERALEPVLPPKETFPYTIRVVSEILSSNGSTSQASVCGSTLALMDAGVPITNPVAGISIGLVTADDGSFRLLTDIQGVEDHSGEMDFKVAGTEKGITAIQVDIKNNGLSEQVIAGAITKAREVRLRILETIKQAIPAPRAELSPYAPRITTIKIDPEKIRTVIGKGGETINKIIDECGGIDVIKIDIEDDGLVMITSANAEMADKAKVWIENLTKDLEIGEEYEGTVTQIVSNRDTGAEIGAIVEVLPGKDGMVHISEFSYQRIASVSDVVNIGDKVKVKVMDVDKERGRVSLSVKALLPKPEGYVEEEPRPRGGPGGFRGRGGFRGGPGPAQRGGRPPFRPRR